MTLKDFLVRVSIDADRLARFVADPDGELLASGVAKADRGLLQSGDAAALQAALAADREPTA
jgi:hypothetical protein